MKDMHYTHKNAGKVCSESVSFDLKGGKIYNVKVKGGCIGNNMSLCKLAEGMDAYEVIDRCAGINCNGIGTSCPDQLACAVRECLEEAGAGKV